MKKNLDEEWRLELEGHADLGRAAAVAYERVVASSSSSASASTSSTSSSLLDVGDVLLAVASDLCSQPHHFADIQTDAFETANKVAELLVHGLSGGKTECGCGGVSAATVELMEEAFRVAEEEVGMI